MATPTRTDRSRSGPISVRMADRDLTALIDAIVAAIDIDRSWEIDKLRTALEPFGGSALLQAEIRLNGSPTIPEWCICGGEAW